MNDMIQLEMTIDEARETDRLIKRHINTTRYLLLDMRDRKGWKALGYESFKEYGEKSFEWTEARLYQLVDAAEIGLQLGYDSTKVESPKETHLRPLKAVPDEERKAIWEEATRKAEEEQAKLTAQLAHRLERLIPALIGGQIPRIVGKEISRGLAKAEQQQRRQAALQAILGVVDPDQQMSLTAATTVIADWLKAFDGSTAMKRIRKGARPATGLESLLMVLIEIPGPRCQRKLWEEAGGKWPERGR